MATPDRKYCRKFRLPAGAGGVALFLLAGVSLLSTWGAAGQRGTDRPTPKPDAALRMLIEGNKRFVEGRLLHPRRTPKDFMAVAEGQKPFAVIVGCADSRVPPEVLFDQGIGDLFVVRVAGNIVDGAGPTVKGSIEYAVGELGARLIMVLGHSQCGAVKAAITHLEAEDQLPGTIGQLIKPIRAAVVAAKRRPGDKLDNVIKENVLVGVRRLETLEPILSKLARTEELKVVGGVYELSTGKVEVLK
jgi:carbonic anhydrase